MSTLLLYSSLLLPPQTDDPIFQSPGRSEGTKEDLSITDDTSSTGNKEDDEDEDEDEGNDENFDGFSRDPERLKAFNVRRYVSNSRVGPNRGSYWLDFTILEKKTSDQIQEEKSF